MIVLGCLLAASVAAIMVFFGPAKKPPAKPRVGKFRPGVGPRSTPQNQVPGTQQGKGSQDFGRR
jgi:hypothetical protein